MSWAVKERPSYAQGETWIEMAVYEEPVPEPEPVEPEPIEVEPDPVEPEPIVPVPENPEVIDFKDIEPPPKEKPPTRRVVQGLSASSFAANSGTGLQVRAGTTVQTRATDELMKIEEAPAVHFSAVTDPPKLRGAAPAIRVPKAAIEAGIEGSWTVYVSIDASGQTIAAELTEPIGYGIDEACTNAWKRSRWKAGLKNEIPIAVNRIPMKCTIRALD
jgi:protein TonB